MRRSREFEIIRDPLWSNIRVEADAAAVVDTEPFQRLRYIRQLGHAFLVYPGATHTRFEHALGADHLAGRAAVHRRNERGNQLRTRQPPVSDRPDPASFDTGLPWLPC